MKKRQIIILSATVLVLAGSFGLSSFFASQKEEPENEKPPEIKKYVRTNDVVYEDIQTDVVAYGRVQTAQSLDLLSEVGGRMYEGKIRLKEGQSFRKGTLLFYVDDMEAELTLKAQKSNFLRDLASVLPDLKVDFSANYNAWQQYFSTLDIDEDFPDLPEVREEKEKTFLATKSIYSNYYTIKSAEVRLKKHRYYAPFNGSIIEVNMESGAFINPGVKIGRIIRQGFHELQVSVETKDIPWIQEGSPTRIFSDETQQYWSGEVLRISDFVNQNTQSVDVFIAINPGGQKIYDGQFLQAAIPARIIKDGMIMPRNAIYNGNEVFVLEDTLLKTRQINIVRVQEESAIFNGLDEGSDLVVEPLINAHNNMKAFKLEDKDIDLETKRTTERELAKAVSNDTATN